MDTAYFCVATESGIMLVDGVGLTCGVAASGTENEDFLAKWRAAGWQEETVEVFEIHNSGWPA